MTASTLNERTATVPATPLETVAAWLEYSGYALRRVYSGQYVFRHVEHGALVTVPAEPRPETVARLLAEVKA